MQTRINKTKNIFNKISSRTCLVASGVLCLAGSVGMTYGFTHASSSEYSLTGSNVTLDGTNDGSATVALKTSVARTYVAVQGTFSLHEVVEPTATETSYLSLSGMTRGGSTALNYGATNGTGIWTPDPGMDGMSVAAGGEVMTATYTVDKDTPAGTYKISFSDGTFTYDNNGTDLDEADIIASDTTITVTRNNDDSGNNDNDEPGTGDSGTTDTDDTDDDEEDEAPVATVVDSDSSDGSDDGGLKVPDTGEMTQDGNGATFAAISVAAVVAVVILSAVVMQVKNHKGIDFNKH